MRVARKRIEAHSSESVANPDRSVETLEICPSSSRRRRSLEREREREREMARQRENQNTRRERRGKRERERETERENVVTSTQQPIGGERSSASIGGEAVQTTARLSSGPSHRLLRLLRRHLRRPRSHVQIQAWILAGYNLLCSVTCEHEEYGE